MEVPLISTVAASTFSLKLLWFGVNSLALKPEPVEDNFTRLYDRYIEHYSSNLCDGQTCH